MKASLWSSSAKSSVMSSPVDGKIQLIAAQIHSLEVPMKSSQKNKDFERLEERSRKVEARVKECDELHQKRVALLGETLSKFTKLLEEERSGTETLYDEQIKRITRLEDKMNDLIGNIEKRKLESDQAVQRYLTEKMNAVWDGVREESADRNKHIDSIAAYNTQIVPDFEKKLRQATMQREDADRKILQEINQSYEEMGNSLQQERKRRDENDQSSFDIIKEFVENARKEINTEKRERERAEESFLSLLEDTCAKLHALAKI